MKLTNKFKSQIKTYLVKRLGAFDYKHGWMRVPICPYCHRENKLGVNLSTNHCNCFRCGAHPSPTQLIMDIEGLDTYAELISLLNNGNFNELTFTEEKVELSESKPVYLPDGFNNISFGTSTLAKSMQGYCRKRGFSVELLSKAGVGYCDSGPLFGYLIIPFYYNGHLKYYNARNVIGNGPRYNNPNKDITGVGKEFIIFNHDALSMYRSVFICEGAINALTMGERGIATMGKSISRYQINEIIKSPVEHIIILLDSDAKDKAIDLALKLVNFKKVKVVLFPDERDVNDLGRSSVLRMIYSTHYKSYQELIQLKNSLNLET